MAVPPSLAPVTQVLYGDEKLQDLNRLLDILELDLKEKNLLPPKRNAILEELKPHCQSVEDADPLFTERGVSILCRHSFDGNSPTTARIALKCLCNVMLLQESTRQIFVDLGYAPKAAERLKSDNREDELLASRLLFLTTYRTNLDFAEIFAQNQLAETINTNLSRHAKTYSKATAKNPVPPTNSLALSETLKLLFNLTQFYPAQVPTFTKSLLYILKILSNVKIPTPPLQPPVNYLINSLINLDLEDAHARHFTQNPLFPIFSPTCNVDRLISILDAAVRNYKAEELDRLANPLVTLLREIYRFAPDTIKLLMRTALLPNNEERVNPLGRGGTLSAYLLRLSTSPLAPSLRESISNLLFDLSGRDATAFVRNVGYGFAAGFLMTHDLPIPENAREAWSSNENGGVEINPVTGQRRDRESEVMVEMTPEEMEQEAEKLFVLFERLRATGVVNVENPVATAVREGRFEEIPDSVEEVD